MPALDQMDLDAYTIAHGDEWNRLGELARSRHRSGRESDELLARYQSGASDLSALRTVYGETRQADLLSVRLSQARFRFTGERRNLALVLGEFFGAQLPAALYRIRWLTLGAALFTFAVAALTALWVLTTPGLMGSLGTESELTQYAKGSFIDYYSEYPEASFAARVFTNNAWIAAQCIAFGALGIVVPGVLMQNAVGLGMSFAVIAEHDSPATFFLWIAPHGQLELTMVFVAAAAGLRLFWAIVVPGARTRLQSLAVEGRSLFTVAIGTTIFLFVSGLIEGFVTRQDWPWPVKIGIGTLALAGFCVYAYVLGRRAYRQGATGDLDEFDAGARVVMSD